MDVAAVGALRRRRRPVADDMCVPPDLRSQGQEGPLRQLSGLSASTPTLAR